ncbi:protein regulator of cytokinesis 1-like isoform X1 [Conger conger]|uniref:protein regulator of cytokinesis 1-like isoform X1 n=2 Tax=Conger conger TaxID=82655 RepID=UPI002A59DA60|nr:protein regulator of cytokinesis 1-like isoform X1 [Conger conger]
MSGRKSEILAFSLVSGINVAMVRLADIWDSIGIMEDQRVERMQTVKKHIEGLLNQMISEEEYLKRRIGNDITTFQKQLEILSQEMSMEPFEFEEGLTVLQTEKSLRLQVEALEKERSGRLEELRSLQRQDEDLCQELNASVYYVPAGSLPTRAELQELRGHVQSLSEEKRSRVVVFSGLREDIRLVMGQMGHEPETSLEEDAVCDDADIFLLTHENINALQLLLCQLEMKRKSLTALRDELEAKAVCLWRRLECPEQEQREFHHNLHGTLSDQITQWQIELDGLSMLQKARLEEVTEKIRLELVEAWDRCMLSPKQREPFNIHFCSGNLTEELLSRHDEELLQVKTFYEKARPLLETVEMWNKNWVLFQDFEKKASDPNRFSNRGGTLLKEAKERVRVQKLLPKLEEELKTRVEAWEKEYGTVFLVWGQRATDYITGQLEEHQQQRGKEKNERMTKKGENTLLKAQSKRSQTGVTGGMTPSKTRKTPNQTMVRTNSFSWASPSGTSLSVSVKSTPSSQKKNRTLDVSSRTPLQEFSSAKKHTEISSYSVFTSTLSKKGSRDAVLNSTAKDVL